MCISTGTRTREQCVDCGLSLGKFVCRSAEVGQRDILVELPVAVLLEGVSSARCFSLAVITDEHSEW